MNRQYKKFASRVKGAALTLALVGVTTIGAQAASMHATTTANLNMRTGAGKAHEVIQTIHKGDSVEVLNNKGSWWKVKYNEKVGYSYRNYLKLENRKTTLKVVEVKVNDCLNVRKDATVKSKILDQLRNGARLEVTGQKGNWYEIKHNGTVAYVCADFCKTVSLNNGKDDSYKQAISNPNYTSNVNDTVKVSIHSGCLLLRQGPSKSNRILDRLENGKKLIVVDKTTNGWYKVKVDGRVGYVYGQYTTTVNENNNTSESTNEKVNTSVKITADSLNVRGGSSVAYGIKGYVHKGQTLNAVEKASNGWYKVQLSNGEFGWVSGRFADEVQQTVKPEQKPVTPEQKPVVPEQKPVTPEQKPEDTTKPEDKPVVPEQKPEDTTKPEDTQKPGDVVKPEDKPVVPDQKPEETPVAPDQKPEDKPSDVVKPGDGGDQSTKPELKPDGDDSDKKDPELVPPSNQAPRIELTDVTLNQGDKFDNGMLNLKVEDPEDGILTGDSVVVSGNVDTNTAGTYTITVKATDTKGRSSQATATITVKAKEVTKPEVKNEAPHIAGENVTINQGEKFDFSMLKVDAIDKEDGVLSDNVKYEGNVNTEKPGDYTVTATVKDSKGLTATASFTVTVKAKEVSKPEVKNEAPVLTASDVTLNQGEGFSIFSLNINAQDKEDGNITNKVHIVSNNLDVNTPGTYKVELSVKDSKGAVATKTVTVTVKAKPVAKNEAPTINAQNVTIEQGQAFDNSMLKASAQDKEDGNLTGSIVYSGNVNVKEAGTYTVTMTVKDKQGLEASTTATVTVNAKKDTESSLVNKLNSSAFQAAVRSNMINLVNAHRQANGLAAYKETSEMDTLANQWSNHMAEGKFCDHVDANGNTSGKLYGVTSGLENVLAIGAGSDTTPEELANNMFNMWKNSAGHNNAMLSDMCNEMGFGYKAVFADSNVSIYATQEFTINWDTAALAPKPEAPKDTTKAEDKSKVEVPVKVEGKEVTPAKEEAPVVTEKAPVKEEVKEEEPVVKEEKATPVVKEEVKTETPATTTETAPTTETVSK